MINIYLPIWILSKPISKAKFVFQTVEVSSLQSRNSANLVTFNVDRSSLLRAIQNGHSLGFWTFKATTTLTK